MGIYDRDSNEIGFGVICNGSEGNSNRIKEEELTGLNRRWLELESELGVSSRRSQRVKTESRIMSR